MTTTAPVTTTTETTTTSYIDPSKDPDCDAPKDDSECMKSIKWAMSDGIYSNPEFYPEIKPDDAKNSLEKFQDYMWRQGEPKKEPCPRPCQNGLAEDPVNFPHTLVTKKRQGIDPPKSPFQYNGIEWPKMTIKGTDTKHIYAIGDWGGLAGMLPHGKKIVQYQGGASRGPHIMGRSRTDPISHDRTCSTPEMQECFGSNGTNCPKRCGYLPDVDVPAQSLVAEQMRKRAKAKTAPDYFLNVGDNFYWGGIEGKCGETPMWKVSDITNAQFKWVFEMIYHGEGIAGKPWFSVLGNHDWGGREMTAAWDQQIAYTWVSDRWVMPAPYWMQTVEYPDQGFTMEYFMLDTNTEDAEADVNANPSHNICSTSNAEGASCAKVGGAASIHECHDWFLKLWNDGHEWMTKKLINSQADWQIAVTHFPCNHLNDEWRDAHLKYGLDLLVTGHTHFQMFYWAPEKIGGMECFITGGGGGITSENNVEPNNPKDHMYGFFDLTLSKDEITIESINWKGNVIDTKTAKPVDGHNTKKGEAAPCVPAAEGSKCWKTITWAKKDGIHSNPEWFPGLTTDSPLSKFQETFWKQNKDDCGKPCLD